MAHQALDAFKFRANRNSNNDAQLDPWIAALLGGKGQGKGQRQQQQQPNDEVVKRLSFLIENCGDVRRNRGLAWYSDSKVEVRCVVTGCKGLQQLMHKDRIVPVWLPAGANYAKSLKAGRALQRIMSLSISERHIERLIVKLEEFFAGMGEVTVFEDLMNAEDEVTVVPMQPVQEVDSDDEWRHRRDQQRGEDVRHRRRWNARRSDQRDQERHHHRRDAPPVDVEGDMRGYRVGDERREDRLRHEHFAMDTGSEAGATPRADDGSPEPNGSGSEQPADPQAEAHSRRDRARRAFGMPGRPSRARSASPRLGRKRSRDRVQRRVQTPVLPAPKTRARRGPSPRRIDASYPPLGHG